MAHRSLDDLSVSELEEMLLRELNSDTPADADMIKAVTTALNMRTNPNSADIDEKWREFREDYAQSEPMYHIPEEKRVIRLRPRRWIKTAVAAAIIVVMTFATVAAADMGGPTVLWSVDSYRFDYANIVGKITAPWFDNVPTAGEMANRILPAELPEGCEPVSLTVEEGTVTAVFAMGGGEITLHAEIIDGQGESSPRDNAIPEEYNDGRVTRYISTDSGKWFAAWTEDGWGITLTGVQSRETLITLLDMLDETEE